jgi:hypothetical protein
MTKAREYEVSRSVKQKAIYLIHRIGKVAACIGWKGHEAVLLVVRNAVVRSIPARNDDVVPRAAPAVIQ